jgi:cell division protein ZapA (FtsZ GTPase activity inhibitor)
MKHELHIAGQHLTVRSTADAAYVRGMASMLEERVRRAEQQGATSIHAWMIVALGLADESSRLRSELDGLRSAVREGVDAALGLVERAQTSDEAPNGPGAAETCDA